MAPAYGWCQSVCVSLGGSTVWSDGRLAWCKRSFVIRSNRCWASGSGKSILVRMVSLAIASTRCARATHVVTAKYAADIFTFCARYDAPPTPRALGPLRITLPAGQTIHAQDPDASAVLSAVLGRPVVLDAPRVTSATAQRWILRPFLAMCRWTGQPGHTAATLPDPFALPPGTFFDSASIHVVASGTLAHLRTLTGDDAQLDPRRFWPNIVVETAPGHEAFVEDDWLKGTLEVGRCSGSCS